MNKEEFKRYFNRKTIDDELKLIIFGDDFDDDFFLEDATTILHYFNNLMILSFVFIYGKYRIWAETLQNNNEIRGNRFLRILHTLGKIYEKNNLSYEIIESLLMNIQIEGENAQIKNSFRLQSAFDSNRKLSFYTGLAKKYRDSAFISDRDSIQTRIQQLKEFTDTFRFMQDLEIVKQKMDNIKVIDPNGGYKPYEDINRIFFKYQGSEIDTRHILIEIKNHYYYLESFIEENFESNYAILNYRSMRNMHRGLTLIVANEELPRREDLNGYFLIEYGALNQIKVDLDMVVTHEEKNDFIRDFYTINYKYIRDLALATTDILEYPTEQAIISKYGAFDKYKMLFNNRISIPKISSINDQSSYNQLSWDAILAILFIEEGASNILELIFKINPNDFKRLLQNLEIRFGKSEDWSDIMFERARVKEENSLNKWKQMVAGNSNKSFIDHHEFIVQQKNYVAELKANHIIEILKEISSVTAEPSKERSIPISINSIIALIRDIRDSSLKNYIEKIDVLKEIVAQTLKTFYLFYIGFFEYVRKKKQFENESKENSFTYDEIAQYQEEANALFEKKVNQEISNLNKEILHTNNYGIKILMDRIKDLAFSCQNALDYNSYHTLLKSSLGRNQLFDFDEIIGLYDCFDMPITSERDFVELSNFIIEKFEYLRTGESRLNPINIGPIFPYVAVHEYFYKTRDGYDVSVFTIVESNNSTIHIKILSEFTYKLNEKYLVLPNLARSSKDQGIWIDPTVINYRRFIKYFENTSQGKTSNLEFLGLKNPKDYPGAARLIYKTDPYIYRDLFGSMENALKVLPILFEEEQSVFYKKNYYIVKKEDKVVGVGGYFAKNVRWNKDHFYRTYLENQLTLPESFHAVSEYYEKTFNLYEDSRNVCNICVDESEQRSGVASFMLKRFVEMSGNEDIHLTVLADNIAAINIYQKHGFKKTYEFLDYGGYQMEPVKCIEMRLIKDQYKQANS